MKLQAYTIQCFFLLWLLACDLGAGGQKPPEPEPVEPKPEPEPLTCNPAKAQVMFVTEASERMKAPIQKKSKWDLVVSSMQKTLPYYKGLEKALLTYPDLPEHWPLWWWKKGPSTSCQVSDVQVGFDPGHKKLLSHLKEVKPKGLSPTAEALKRAYDYFEAHKKTGKQRNIVLIVDGRDTCGGDVPKMIKKLRSIGVDTWVIAFEDSADSAMLNLWAELGGHPLAGPRQYRVLRTSSDLAEVLDEIVGTKTKEVCDGKDNDCDGQTDEDLVRTCPLACGGGVQFCKNGHWGGCVDPMEIAGSTIPDIPAETCDGKDNDCDGEMDEDFDVGGPCMVEKGACVTTGQFVCSADGKGVVCNAKPPEPSPEVCDGLDNDCDGETDEDLVVTCETECGQGVKVCKGGKYGSCQVTKPNPEVCDGKDNDCDGTTDETFPVGKACKVGEGACVVTGVYVCSQDGLGVECLASGGTPTGGPEVCNGLDDDCDGVPDNGGVCPNGQACFKGQCVYD